MENETIVSADFSQTGWGVAVRLGSVVIVTAAIVAVFAYSFDVGISRSEISECEQWQQQEQEFPSQFYLLSWQDEQCRAHGIVINAPIK